jgi:peptidyl-prolyl cis-trans isomerase B (cyclophilin B)
VVTKKRRRTQLARASAQRRELRRAERERRRRRVRLLVTLLVALAVVVGLAAWIALHDGDSGSAAAQPGDYAVLDLSHDRAPTAEGAR